MTPYEIQQRVLSYLEDTDMTTVVRRFINEAIQRLCSSHEADKDYSFLRTTATLDCATAFTNNVANLPSLTRAVVDLTFASVSPAVGFEILGNRTVKKPATTTTGLLTVDYYQQHPSLTITGTWAADGTVPAETILVPAEFHPLIVWMALDLCYEHEIEVNAQREQIAKRIDQGVVGLRASYSMQIYPLAQVMTALWLTSLGSYYAGSERNRAYMLNYINNVAAEVCDRLKIQYAERPSTVSGYTDTLPQIHTVDIPALLWQKGMFFHVAEKYVREDYEARLKDYEGAAENFRQVYYDKQIQEIISLGTFANRPQILIDITNEIIDDIGNGLKLKTSERPSYVTSASTELPTVDSKVVPRDIWRHGLYLKLAKLYGTQETATLDKNYTLAVRDFSNLFYARDVSTTPSTMATYGDLVDYMKQTGQTHLNDGQLWKIANRAVSEFLSKIDVEDLVTYQEYTTVSGTQEYALPATLKKVYRVLYDGVDLVGWNFDNPRTPDDTNDYYQGKSESNYFSIVGRNLILRDDPKSGVAMTVWYYVKSAWENDSDAALPIDGHYVMPYCDMHLALLEKDYAAVKIHKEEFLSGLKEYDENQIRNIPKDEKFYSGYPSTGQILTIISGGS